jgi:hypothetical protein
MMVAAEAADAFMNGRLRQPRCVPNCPDEKLRADESRCAPPCEKLPLDAIIFVRPTNHIPTVGA